MSLKIEAECSPLTQGTLDFLLRRIAFIRFIPADAGNTVPAPPVYPRSTVYRR